MNNNKSTSFLKRAVFVGVSCSFISSCAVGPDFKQPKIPDVNSYTRTDVLKDKTDQTVDVSQAIPEDWWTLFNSSELNELINKAFKNNPSLEVAQASLKIAEENTLAQYASFFPSIQAGYSASRQQDPVGTISPTLSGNAPISIYNLHNAHLNISYVPDVFGLNQRTVESLRAQEEIQRYQIQATYLTLASNIAINLIQIATIEDQIKETNKIIEANQKALNLIKIQAELGGANGLDIASQESLLSQFQAYLPPLQKQLELYKDQLANLIGEPPNQISLKSLSLEDFKLPQNLPLSLPSELVKQRPDMKAAEAVVHVSSAQVGVALANRLPQFSITGVFGGVSTGFGQMFDKGNRFWGLSGGVTQSVFDFGALKHKQRAAEAALDQATSQYRYTALAAFQNVADTLYTLDSDQKAINAAVKAESSSTQTLKITTAQLEAGDINVLAFWNAETAHRQAVINVIQLRGQQYSDTVALFQALGGSWKAKPL